MKSKKTQSNNIVHLVVILKFKKFGRRIRPKAQTNFWKPVEPEFVKSSYRTIFTTKFTLRYIDGCDRYLAKGPIM